MPTVNHIRSTSLPSTTSFWKRPLIRTSGDSFPLSIGGLGGVAVGALGAYDLYRASTNNEDGSWFSWGNIFRILGWGSFAGIILSISKPPKNLFHTDLINNGVKDILENIIDKLGDKNTFAQILSDKSINNLNSALNGMLEKACTEINSHLMKLGEERVGYQSVTDILRNRDPLLLVLYQEIFNETAEEERPAKLRAFLKREGGDFIRKFSMQEKDLHKEIMSKLFVSKNTEPIKAEINKITERIGLNLLSIEHDRPSDEIKLYFVNVKGYSPGSSNNNDPLQVPGIMVSLTPEQFFNGTSYLVDNLSELYRTENIKELLEGKNTSTEKVVNLNKKILSCLGPLISDLNTLKRARGIHAIYDPKTRQHTLQNILDPILDMLNETANSSKRKLEGIVGQGGPGSNVIGAVGGLGATGGYAAGRGSGKGNDGDNTVTADRTIGGKTVGGGGYDYDELNDSKTSNTPNKSRAEIKERDHINKMLNDVLGLNKGLGVVLNREGNASLTELKLSLIAMHIRFLTNKFASKEKSEILLRNAFLDMHAPEIEAEKKKIVGEIRKRKDQVMNSEDIDNEINTRLEQFTENLIESKFEKERSAGQIIVTNNIDSIELPQNRKDELDEMYAGMAETLSQAVDELLPGNEHLGKGRELKLREASNIARRYNIRDFLLVALEASLSRNEKGETLKIDGTNILITSPNGSERSISDNTQLFYELARSTPAKTTSQAISYLESLFRVLDKDHAKVLREQTTELKDKVLELSNKAKEQRLGIDSNTTSNGSTSSQTDIVKK